MKRFHPVLWALTAMLLVSCSKDSGDSKKLPSAKVVPVLAAKVVRQSVPLEIGTFGTVQPMQAVTVKAQVTGVLTKVHFRKGQEVRKGDLLFEIDSRPFLASLQQNQAARLRDQAQLDNAQKELVRQSELRKKGIAAQADFDKAQMDVDTAQAVIKSDAAAIENANLQVGYCAIRAPIDGRAGDLLVDEGNLVKAEDVSLVTINQVQPVQVYFSISQRDLPAVRQYMAQGTLKVRATVPNASEPAEEGELTFVDNNVDPTTGTIRLAATFPNHHEKLWPGTYVDVALTLAIQKNAVVLPAQAIQTGRDGRYVFVLAPDAQGTLVAQVRPVTIDRTAGGVAIVESGVSEGEQVVTDGQVLLLPGAKVVVKTDLLEPRGASSQPKEPSASSSPSGGGNG
jgi:multidrug efflux system membrane fusion protein